MLDSFRFLRNSTYTLCLLTTKLGADMSFRETRISERYRHGRVKDEDGKQSKYCVQFFIALFFLFLVKSFSLCILLLLPFVVNKAYHKKLGPLRIVEL